MKRVLVVHPSFRKPGGDNCVAAWALQALRDEFAVTLLTWTTVDLDLVNARFGTTLVPTDFRMIRVPLWRRGPFHLTPFHLFLLKMGVLYRHARSLIRRQPFDVVISTANEIDVGAVTIQYIHYPWACGPRPEIDYSWYHFSPLVQAYRRGTRLATGLSHERIARNVTLANSAWTAVRFQDCYGAPARILHPPAPVERHLTPWRERRDVFACIGRISPEKRILEIIEILAEVRRRGHEIALQILGHRDDWFYEQQVRAAAARHPEWISIAVDLTRDELLDRAESCRYGIHGMIGEHFGIAVAEMVRLGCVCFAPDDGGPREILTEGRLLYSSSADAVAKISSALGDPGRLAELRATLARRAEHFSTTKFMDEFRMVCREVADRKKRADPPLLSGAGQFRPVPAWDKVR